MRYVLVATLDGETEMEDVDGDAGNMPERVVPLMVYPDAPLLDVQDADASIAAMFVVIRRAEESRLWARGRIELRRGGEDGDVVRVMEAKEV